MAIVTLTSPDELSNFHISLITRKETCISHVSNGDEVLTEMNINFIDQKLKK